MLNELAKPARNISPQRKLWVGRYVNQSSRSERHQALRSKAFRAETPFRPAGAQPFLSETRPTACAVGY